MVINLSEDMLIARGYKRLCYQFPNSPEKIIKIDRKENKKANDNLIESIYYKYLNKKGANFSHIAKCYGWVETSKGKGLVFEKITDFNGLASSTLEHIIINKILTKLEIDELIKELKHYLEKNQILFADIGLGNILCQKTDKKNYKLIIIDGLGSAKYDFRFKLRMSFDFYNRYKIITQWKRFMKKYQERFDS
ncbi:MAG: hypothetical protein QG567_794 [Campylobacterota bacterium]|nr:hypothetical protein [Campylobacterota bacterium]